MLTALMLAATAVVPAAAAEAADFWWRGAQNSIWTTSLPATNFVSASFGGLTLVTLPGVSDTVRFANSAAVNLTSSLGGSVSILRLTTDAQLNGDVSIAGGAGQTLTLGSGGIVAAAPRQLSISAIVRTTAANYSISAPNAISRVVISSALTENKGLSKSGGGTLTLSGNNTFTGPTTIFGGTLRLGGSGALPVGNDVFVQGGVLDLSGNNASVGDLVFGGGTGLSRAVTNTGAGSAALTVSGNISYNGDGAFADIAVPMVLTAGTHALDNPNSISSGSFYDMVIRAPVSGAGGLIMTGSHSVVLGAANNYMGSTVVEAGRLNLGFTNALPATTDVTVNGGTLRLNLQTETATGVLGGNFSQTIRSLGGSGGSIVVGNATLTVNQSVNTTYAGMITGAGGSLVKSGVGTLTLSGETAHTGRTTFAGGVLNVANPSSLNNSGTLTFTGGTLQYSAANQVDYSSRIRNSSDPIRIDTNGQTVSYASGLVASNTGGLTKSGAGVLALNAANTYTGPTTISGGTLRLGGANSLPAGNNVFVENGALDLAGNNVSVGDLVFGGGSGISRAVTNTAGGSAAMTLAGNIDYDGSLDAYANIAVPVVLTAGIHVLDSPNSGPSGSAYDVVFRAPISGLGGLRKTGTNAVFFVVLAAANSYAGPTLLDSGQLILSATGALPATTDLTVNGSGALRLDPRVTASGAVRGNYSQTVRSLSGSGGTVLLGTATLTVNQSVNTTYAGSILGDGGSLVKSGVGSLTLGGSMTYTGNTTVTGGLLEVRRPLRTAAGTLGVTGGEAILSANPAVLAASGSVVSGEFSTINAGAGGVVTLASVNRGTSRPNVLITSELFIARVGFVDMTNNDMIFRAISAAGASAAVSSLSLQVRRWYIGSAGLPGMVGLGSSSAFYDAPGAFTTLAVYNNALPGQTLTSFNGISVSATDVLVSYTYLGDTNIDGIVDAADIARILQGINGQGSGWNFGDLNYDGAINTLDLGRALAALRGQGIPLGQSGVGAGSPIPEPSTLALLLPALAIAQGRRTRSSR